MKKITGGYGQGILIAPGTCGWVDRTGYPVCNISKGAAQMLNMLHPGGYWCCQSCASRGGSASYC
ncbi:rSAM-modified peptide [Algoriphagus formosus]|uniref:rSAM-modified peptide n=1 Tax=Algoriphagus formosus TaxID=2007308 RepID=UPI000C2881E8|nr:rSAM-modified peptide [Algoriphagus formosus]